jgi:hypothetical protein
VEKALMWSNLRPLARLVVLALLTKVDSDTCIIPAEFTPSLLTLHAMTAIAKSQIVKELDYLEQLGWVKRSRPDKPSRNGRTSYALAVGDPDADRPTGPHRGPVRRADKSTGPSGGQDQPVRRADSTPPANEQESGAEEGESGPSGGQDHADGPTASQGDAGKTAGHQRSAGRTGPPDGPASTNYQDQSQTHKTSSSEANDQPPRADVEQLCTHLADKIEVNGSKRPTITKAWRDEARRLLDIDARPLDKALALIDWCQNDTFWRSNVQSMPKFRKQYDQLRLKALAEWEADRNRGSPRRDSRTVSTAEGIKKWKAQTA